MMMLCDRLSVDNSDDVSDSDGIKTRDDKMIS